MAGRGTDIMLGGNSEFLAKEEMRKLRYTAEQIRRSNSILMKQMIKKLLSAKKQI